MGYQFRKDDAFAFAASIGAVVSEKGNELHFRFCPYCKGGDHHDKDTFSVNLEHGAFCCLRSSCGRQGHFVELCRDFNYPLQFAEQPKKKYRNLVQRPVRIRNKAIEFMASRGISEDVCRAYNITTQSKADNVIVFPFYDADGIMQTVLPAFPYILHPGRLPGIKISLPDPYIFFTVLEPRDREICPVRAISIIS
jgi:twinkle protein